MDTQEMVNYWAAVEAWLAAENRFNEADEPDLVSIAVLELAAAEARVNYWARRMRERVAS